MDDSNLSDLIGQLEEDERKITACHAVFTDYETGAVQDKLIGFDRIRAILEGRE